MATTLTAATLTVAVAESITLGGTVYDSTSTKTIASVKTYSKRIMSIPASTSSTLMTFAGSPSGLEYDSDDIQYIRITNLDDAEQLIVTLAGSGSGSATALNPLSTRVLFGNGVNGAASKAAITTVQSLETIFIRNSSGAAVDIEVVIATT